jgi:hypothetical protein
MKNYVSPRITLLALAAAALGICLLWKLLERLHARGIYTFGSLTDAGQYSDNSGRVVWGLAAFFGLLILAAAIAPRMGHRKKNDREGDL